MHVIEICTKLVLLKLKTILGYNMSMVSTYVNNVSIYLLNFDLFLGCVDDGDMTLRENYGSYLHSYHKLCTINRMNINGRRI